MRRPAQDVQDIKEMFDQSFPVPSREQADLTCERVLDRLNNLNVVQSGDVELSKEAMRPSRSWWQLTPLRVAVALVGLAVVAVPFLKSVLLPENVYAIVESSEGQVYRVFEGKRQAVSVGDRINAGTVVRTDEKAAVLALPDGARIAMEPMSEVLLEQAKDGVKIFLNDGGARITPAKEPSGNLYLQNRDALVPVIAEMFQSVTRPQVAAEPDATFEEVSIRPVPLQQGGVNGRNGAPDGAGPALAGTGCPVTQFQLTPGRFIAERITLAGLIGLAYANRCLSQEVFFGGPDWTRIERFEVQALIPAGTPGTTSTELRDGKSPKLQKMFQTMLATRFKLSVRREMREMPVYNLVLTKPEKLVPAGDRAATIAHFLEVRRTQPTTGSADMTLAEYAAVLQNQTGRPVIDKTNVSGRYDFLVILPDGPLTSPPPPDAGRDFIIQLRNSLRDQIVSRLEDQLGLKLEPSRAQVEVLVVERAEKPSEN